MVRASCPAVFSQRCGVDYTIRVPRSTPIVVKTSDGSVTATGYRSPTVDAHSSDGRVRLSFDAPPQQVNASSSDGSVTVLVPGSPDAYHVDAHSSDGPTTVGVRTDPTSNRLIQATSSDGSVTVAYP